MVRKPRPQLPPSYRNLQLYHALAFERRTQTAVAATFGLAQCRVAQIAKKVRAWVDRILPLRHCKNDPGARFHIAIARERLRLQAAHEPLIEFFTTGEEFPRYLRRYVAIIDGQPVETIEITEEHDFRLMNQALDATTRLAKLDAIAHLGPYANLAMKSHQTIIRTFDNPSKPPSNPTETASNASEKPGRGVLEALHPLPSGSPFTPFPPTTYNPAAPTSVAPK